MQALSLWKTALSLIMAGALVACGGGNGAAGTPPAAAVVSGIAAVGAPLTGATVSLLCGNGGPPTTANTSSLGSYSMTLATGCSAPYFLKVVGIDKSVTPNVTVTLYAFADALGNVNITPLTDIAAQFATGGNPDAEYEAVKAASKKVGELWTAASAAQAKAKLLETLQSLGLSTTGISDVLHGAFTATSGNPTDDLLEALRRARGGLSLADLAAKALQLGGTPGDKPWNALFRVGQNEIKLNLTGCRIDSDHYSGETEISTTTSVTSATAVLTLTRSGNSLTASVTHNSTSTVTFTPIQWGAGDTDDFSFSTLRADSVTYVSPYMSQQTLGVNNGQINAGLLMYASKGSQEIAPGNTTPGQRAKFGGSMQDGIIFSSKSIDCQVTNPLTTSNIGSFQPQARLASYMSVSPTISLTSATEPASDGIPAGACGLRTLIPGEGIVLTGNFTFAVSSDGVISFDGQQVGDYWNSSLYTSAQYYESYSISKIYPPSNIIRVELTDNKGFYTYRSDMLSLVRCHGQPL